MRKFFIILVIAAIGTSCSSMQNVSARGVGYSESSVISLDKANLNAAAHASEQNNLTVTVSNTQVETDADGGASGTFTRTTTSTSATTFYNNSFTTQQNHWGGVYKTTSTFSGNAKKTH